MDTTIIFLITLGIVVLFLIIVNFVLIKYSLSVNKKIDILLEKGKIKNFKEIFLSQKEKNEKLEEKIKEAFLKIKNLEDLSEVAIQKIGIIRFNPFNDMGGNQSFIIAMLDSKNNGFIVSSLLSTEGSRVYAKAVKNGKSDYSLSNEEAEALDRAINSK